MENEAAPTCPECGHRNRIGVNGLCIEPILGRDGNGYIEDFPCNCKCVFPAAPTAADAQVDLPDWVTPEHWHAPTADHLPDDEKVAREIVEGHKCGTLYIGKERTALTKRIASALTAVRKQVAEQWRPIESAPDATYVLVWLENYGINVALLTKHPTGDHWWMRDHGEYCYPKFWMPLPAGPQEKMEDGQ